MSNERASWKLVAFATACNAALLILQDPHLRTECHELWERCRSWYDAPRHNMMLPTLDPREVTSLIAEAERARGGPDVRSEL